MKSCFQHVKGVKWKPSRQKVQHPEVEFENITVTVSLTGHLTWICPEMGSGRSWKLNYLDDHPKKRSKPYHCTSGSSKKKKSGRQLDKEDRAWLVSHMEHSPEVSCNCHPSLYKQEGRGRWVSRTSSWCRHSVPLLTDHTFFLYFILVRISVTVF